MNTHREILVAAVVLLDAESKVLSVRKRGTSKFMQPGGKPEPGEPPVRTAARELAEEVGLLLREDQLTPLGRFTAEAANEPGHTVVSDVFVAEMDDDAAALLGALEPAAEIAELRWIPLEAIAPAEDLAPLMTTQIIPAVRDLLGHPETDGATD